MSITSYLQTSHLELEKVRPESGYAKDHVGFVGAPRKHPYDADKVMLIIDPFSSNTTIYEFRIGDIGHVEDVPSIVAESGESLRMARLWIKRGRLGVKIEPFVVEEPLRYLRKTEELFRRAAE